MVRVASNSTDSVQVVAIIFKIAVNLLRKSPSLSHPPRRTKKHFSDSWSVFYLNLFSEFTERLPFASIHFIYTEDFECIFINEISFTQRICTLSFKFY